MTRGSSGLNTGSATMAADLVAAGRLAAPDLKSETVEADGR
jgi:hypothetical protein